MSAEENIMPPLSIAGDEPDRGWVEELVPAPNAGPGTVGLNPNAPST
jgi:hypothetical protein